MAETSSGAASRCTNQITDLYENDVLLDRGMGPNQFIGNQWFRILITEQRESYNDAKKEQ